MNTNLQYIEDGYESSVALTALGWLWWRIWSRLGPCDAALFCVAGVALGDICLRFVWQAWHSVTSAFSLCGRRGTYGIGLALVAHLVAAGALRGTYGTGLALVAHLAWHLRHWAGSGGAFGRGWGLVTPRLFCVAGVALGDICLHFVWQAWHLRRGWGPVTLRLFCVAGVALGDICFRFLWQAWHSVTSAFTLCGRRGTYGTGLVLVAHLVAAGAL
eukprot:s3688_g5.t1